MMLIKNIPQKKKQLFYDLFHKYKFEQKNYKSNCDFFAFVKSRESVLLPLHDLTLGYLLHAKIMLVSWKYLTEEEFYDYMGMEVIDAKYYWKEKTKSKKKK